MEFTDSELFSTVLGKFNDLGCFFQQILNGAILAGIKCNVLDFLQVGQHPLTTERLLIFQVVDVHRQALIEHCSLVALGFVVNYEVLRKNANVIIKYFMRIIENIP